MISYMARYGVVQYGMVRCDMLWFVSATCSLALLVVHGK